MEWRESGCPCGSRDGGRDRDMDWASAATAEERAAHSRADARSGLFGFGNIWFLRSGWYVPRRRLPRSSRREQVISTLRQATCWWGDPRTVTTIWVTSISGFERAIQENGEITRRPLSALPLVGFPHLRESWPRPIWGRRCQPTFLCKLFEPGDLREPISFYGSA